MGRLLPVALLLASLAPRASAEEPAPKPPAPAPAAGEVETKPAPPKVIPDAEASPLAEGLKKAWRAKTAEDALPALRAIEGKAHPSFEAPLVKLLGHASAEIAIRSADALAERAGPKTATAMWRGGWLSPANRDRTTVRTSILRALGRMGTTLDAKQYDEVESLWKKATSGETLSAIAEYFGSVKTDKRPLRLLSEALDEPIATAVNSASNPPASYWEARWKMWKASQPAVQAALKSITGQTFESSAQAKDWFKKNEKEFGFVW
jgi:hypothetical protein